LELNAPHEIRRPALRLLLECAGKSTLFNRFDYSSYEVKKEVSMGRARSDVAVIGNNFLVAIEIKRALGVETKVACELQCGRLNRGAKQYGAQHGIEAENILSIFLTPQKVHASDRAVACVSTHRLLKRLERVIPSSKSFMDFLRKG